ncbi:hypothetical protein EOM82_05565 [bacterium]|nr:hypothetical protein [bacterium]
MLKIIKYDLKSIGIIMTVMCMAALVVSITYCCLTANTIIEQMRDKLLTGFTMNKAIYCIFVILMVGNMWRKVNSETELYEIAGVSPLKVGAARMLEVFVSVSIFAALLTLGESLLYKIYLTRAEAVLQAAELPQEVLNALKNNCIHDAMFAVNGMRWTNIFTPLFSGLYISILFTTSFLFATVNRRIKHMFASSMLLGGLVILVLMLNFMVLNKINIYLPELNLNKAFPIIERFSSNYAGKEYTHFEYLINPNLLNMGLLLFNGLYVALMFSIYSIRRKAI